jgi:AcrR family transcriptional regulator
MSSSIESFSHTSHQSGTAQNRADENNSSGKKFHKKTEDTRLAMIYAAIEIFGRDGFHAASNRELAKTAGVNLALISYHFGGKEGLYLAVFEYISAQIHNKLKPVIEVIECGLKALTEKQQSQISLDDLHYKQQHKKQCVQLIENLLFANIEMLSSKETAPWAKLILKEQQEFSPAFEILYRGHIGDFLIILAKLIASVLQISPTDNEAKLSAMQLFGQILILRVGRATVMRYMDWQDISVDEISLVKKQISLNVKALFIRY